MTIVLSDQGLERYNDQCNHEHQEKPGVHAGLQIDPNIGWASAAEL
jgi:hypothetical protein